MSGKLLCTDVGSPARSGAQHGGCQIGTVARLFRRCGKTLFHALQRRKKRIHHCAITQSSTADLLHPRKTGPQGIEQACVLCGSIARRGEENSQEHP